MKFALGERAPALVGERHFIADNAVVIGDVVLHDAVSVWFSCVLRGDNERIEIGARSNVQDASVLHTDPGFPLHVGDGVTLGHRVMLHGCSIGDNTLVGIGSTVLNGAIIGRDSIVGANSLVTEKKAFPDRSLIFGAPAKVVRTLSDREIAAIAESAAHYVENAARYRDGLQAR